MWKSTNFRLRYLISENRLTTDMEKTNSAMGNFAKTTILREDSQNLDFKEYFEAFHISNVNIGKFLNEICP